MYPSLFMKFVSVLHRNKQQDITSCFNIWGLMCVCVRGKACLNVASHDVHMCTQQVRWSPCDNVMQGKHKGKNSWTVTSMWIKRSRPLCFYDARYRTRQTVNDADSDQPGGKTLMWSSTIYSKLSHESHFSCCVSCSDSIFFRFTL